MIVRSNKSHLEEWIIHFGMTPFTITSIYCLKLFLFMFLNIRGYVTLSIPPRRQVSGKLMVASCVLPVLC